MEYFTYKDGFGWLSPMTKESFEVELNDPMTAELEHFVDLVRGRETKPRCTGEDGLATLKVINAVQESVDTHMPVDID